MLQTTTDERLGYVHLVPVPEATDVDRMYRFRYYQQDHPQEGAKMSREWRYWRDVYERRFRMAGTLARSVLDVGAGFGHFLEAVAASGGTLSPACAAVEPSYAAQRILQDKGFKTYGSIEQVDHSADFVHCALVLEHIVDPLALLKEIHKCLTWRGTLCVVVPNEFNPLQNQMVERFGYSPVHQEHINYFSIGTIKDLLHKAGFVVFHTETNFPMEWFALNTPLNYVLHPWTGPIAHKIRMGLERLAIRMGWWDDWSSKWAQQGIGREVVLYAQKRIGVEVVAHGFAEMDGALRKTEDAVRCAGLAMERAAQKLPRDV